MANLIPHYLDASVAAKLAVKEPDSVVLEQYVAKRWASQFYITEFAFYEVLGVLKRKWLKGELPDHQYYSAFSVLEAYLKDDLLVIDRDFRPDDRRILLDLKDIVERRRIDYSDALQIYALLNGRQRGRSGPFETVLVSADKGLVEAAELEGPRVWHFPHGEPPKDE